jgi:hypothetical protein
MAASAARGRSSIRATTAAASGTSIATGPPVTPTLAPSRGALSMAPSPDSTAAAIQVTRDRRRTGMPSRLARSCESAAPRMAMPRSDRARNHHSATPATADAATAIRWSAPNTSGPMRCSKENGAWKVV